MNGRAKLGINEFRKRRQKLLSMMDPRSIALIPAAAQHIRNRDTEYPFRQDSDFYYLTGFTEPDALLALVPGRDGGECILFCRERNPERERWVGEFLGPDRAVQLLGMDDAFPFADLDEIAPGLLEGCSLVNYAMGVRPDFDARVLGWVHGLRTKMGQGKRPPAEIKELSLLLHELRLFKQPSELKLMRAAAEITARAHRRAMQVCAPGMNEARLEAELLYEFALGGARHPAYECIVGGGDNACVMHYVHNNAPLSNGQMVLIDAGCEYEHYACDITRTFPVNGKFSAPQRALYEVVLRAQLAAIEAMRVGSHFNRPHEVAVATMTEGMLALGILKGDAQQIIANEDYRRFTIHKTSHWLGLDVHDVGDYRIGEVWRELAPNMVLTIEPGIYIPSSMTDVPAEFRGIGIRIEDDVLITANGPEVLTTAAPKTIAEIEDLMRG